MQIHLYLSVPITFFFSAIFWLASEPFLVLSRSVFPVCALGTLFPISPAIMLPFSLNSAYLAHSYYIGNSLDFS